MSAQPAAPRGAVLVTGASTGIGRATTERLARAGIPVIAGVRKEADTESLATIANVEPIILDVTKEQDVAALAERVAGGALRGVVNNAGYSGAGPLEVLPIDELRRQFEVNVFACIAVAQATLPALRAGRGRIVNIGSIGGRVGQPFVGPYCGSKGAIHLMSASLRMELRPWGIWVACVEPGTIATEIWDKGASEAEGVLAAMTPDERHLYERTLTKMRDVVAGQAKRGLSPDDVAERVEHALTARRPKAYYLVGADARALNAIDKVLPARLRDRVLARALGI